MYTMFERMKSCVFASCVLLLLGVNSPIAQVSAQVVDNTNSSVTAVEPVQNTTVYWDLGWVEDINPDGLYSRRVVGVNGSWPIPGVTAYYGAYLILTVKNSLPTIASVHAHGMYQNGTSFYDGAYGINTCGIPPGETFTFHMPLQQTGTYWIHGHNNGLSVDGFRTSFVILDPPANNTLKGGSQWQDDLGYDEEIIINLEDWYHTEHCTLIDFFLGIYNPTGKEPIPESALINHGVDSVIQFEYGKTYLLRVIAMSALARFNMYIDGHDMYVVEVDGVRVQMPEEPVSSLFLSTAQRYAVIVRAKNESESSACNYYLHADLDLDMFDNPPDTLDAFPRATVQYPDGQQVCEESAESPVGNVLMEDDFTPLVVQEFRPADISIALDVTFELFDDGVNHGTFNQTVYKTYEVIPYYSAISTPDEQAMDSLTYGPHGTVYPLDRMQTVEVIITNNDAGNHPFHLHGQHFQVITLVEGGTPEPFTATSKNPANPARRDTVTVPSEGSAVIHFYTDNPGAWLFHCHIEWHLEAGLAVVFVVDPTGMQASPPPEQHTKNCLTNGFQTEGNAAGVTTANEMSTYPDTSEYDLVEPWPVGFTTPESIGALVGCIASCFLGLGVVIFVNLKL
ncbi:hypothetical protein SARC_11277 [Sphaeroforma arctica JP610]|uniref:Uncharacterized protein n=1 Tax=Sphaeroforma arctica JP610 TaxID=667725 RepID=A0A0L0FJL1_9EUKA|nr:hypothetical protein SARC_11277 [Sphaeroforma arctica JP610]KNC76213.1 hypothetical protein SARC_11277 [Sphaeroforma arctica JP610]|eukprot:XP_014150115.1 hypothetical protein SARC_11277 [Sphaeroforma arctica JP610]